MFSGRWSEDQERWLAHLKKVSNNFNFDHICGCKKAIGKLFFSEFALGD